MKEFIIKKHKKVNGFWVNRIWRIHPLPHKILSFCSISLSILLSFSSLFLSSNQIQPLFFFSLCFLSFLYSLSGFTKAAPSSRCSSLPLLRLLLSSSSFRDSRHFLPKNSSSIYSKQSQVWLPSLTGTGMLAGFWVFPWRFFRAVIPCSTASYPCAWFIYPCWSSSIYPAGHRRRSKETSSRLLHVFIVDEVRKVMILDDTKTTPFRLTLNLGWAEQRHGASWALFGPNLNGQLYWTLVVFGFKNESEFGFWLEITWVRSEWSMGIDSLLFFSFFLISFSMIFSLFFFFFFK